MDSYVLYDTNIIGKLEYEKLNEIIEKSNNFLTDDVAKELLDGKKKHEHNEEFMKKINLIFNEKEGLNENFVLLVSHIQSNELLNNTMNKIFLKKNPDICSAHHFWIGNIFFPCLITDVNRHTMNMLTWYLKKGNVDFNESNFNKIKSDIIASEMKIAKPYFTDSNISSKKLVQTWSKRDKDIIIGKDKITDGRLVIHAMDLILAFRCNVTIYTADYDVLNMQNNFYSSLIDKYVIYDVLEKECKAINLAKDKKEIYIPIKKFKTELDHVIDRIKNSKDVFVLEVIFFNKKNNAFESVKKYIPVWLFEFMMKYNGNLVCWALDRKEEYPIKYIWYSAIGNKEIKFEVWKEPLDETEKYDHIKCKLHCKYEKDEINFSPDISGFIEPKSN